MAIGEARGPDKNPLGNSVPIDLGIAAKCMDSLYANKPEQTDRLNSVLAGVLNRREFYPTNIFLFEIFFGNLSPNQEELFCPFYELNLH